MSTLSLLIQSSLAQASFQPDLIFQVIVGLGMIGAMWKLAREVSCLSAKVEIWMDRSTELEDRVRDLELKEAARE